MYSIVGEGSGIPMRADLTDAQLRLLTNYVHPDEATDYVRKWIHGMAAELLDLRAYAMEHEQLLRSTPSLVRDLLARVAELETERGQLHTDRLHADQRTIDAEQRIFELEAEADHLRERRRTWLLRYRTARDRVAELEAAQRPPLGATCGTAVDAMDDIRQTLADNGFHIVGQWGQSLIYRMPNGDRFELRVTKKRGK